MTRFPHICGAYQGTDTRCISSKSLLQLPVPAGGKRGLLSTLSDISHCKSLSLLPDIFWSVKYLTDRFCIASRWLVSWVWKQKQTNKPTKDCIAHCQEQRKICMVMTQKHLSMGLDKPQALLLFDFKSYNSCSTSVYTLYCCTSSIHLQMFPSQPQWIAWGNHAATKAP